MTAGGVGWGQVGAVGVAIVTPGSRTAPEGRDRYYRQAGIRYPDVANPDLLSRIPANALTILDVGCGSGALGAACRTLNPGARLLGIECDPDMAAIAEQRLDAVACVDVEQNPLPLELPNGVDCLIYGDILQQLHDPWAVLQRQLGALNPLGTVLVCVANAEHWSIVDRLLRGTWAYEPSGPLDIRHLRWFSLRTIVRALTDAGLVVDEVYPRIFAIEQAHQFVQMMTPGLRALGIDPSEYISRALPLQYVLRARRDGSALSVAVKPDLRADDASLVAAAPGPADLALQKEVAADDIATEIVYFERSRVFAQKSNVELGPTFTEETARPLACPSYSTEVRGFRFNNVVLDPACMLLFDSDRPIRDTHYLLDDAQFQDARVLPERLVEVPADQSYIIGCNRAHANYYHWLIQALPAMDCGVRARGGSQPTLALPTLASWQERSLELLGLAELPRLTLDIASQYLLPKVEYSEFLNGRTALHISLQAIETFRRVRSRVSSTPARHDVIYVARTATDQRVATNEVELIGRLEQEGVEIIVPGSLSLDDQINTFRAARLIIGPPGAGLSNIVFCEPGAVLYELIPEHYQTCCINRLALAAGIDYTADLFPSSGEEGWVHDRTWEYDLDGIMDRVTTLNRRFPQTSSHSVAALHRRITSRDSAIVGTSGVEIAEANERFLQQAQAEGRPVANGAEMDLADAIRAAGDIARARDPTAADVFAGSLVESGLDAEDLVTVGLALRDGGRASAAAIVLQDVIAKWPTVVAAHYELAFLHRLEGRHLDGVRALLAAAAVDPSDLRVTTFLVHMLHAVGAHAEAKRYHDAVMPRAGDYASELTLLQEFGSYLRDWPLGAALLLLERVQHAYGWLDTKQVADRVIAALDERQPFALVRLGDGEGSCISLGEDDERRFPGLYAKNRDELTAMWFGKEFEAGRTGFARLSRRIVDIALGCDIVGIPYEGWLTHEYGISSTRGIPSLVNVLRAFEAVQLCASPRPMLCSQLVHADLQSSGELERIIRHAKRLTLISCIPELPDLLRQQFGIELIEFYRIPGERGSAAVLGSAAIEGDHYPEVYERLQGQLRRPHHGRLFLIAGGILGKFCAQTIREFGGVALDIGSVADVWAGKLTRPGADLSRALTKTAASATCAQSAADRNSRQSVSVLESRKTSMSGQHMFQNVMQALWKDMSPYTGFPHRRFRADLQGWNSHHIFLSETIIRKRPTVIVEIGVWKGGSTIHMAQTMREHGLDAVVIAVDTWLGSWEYWEQDEWFPDLLFEFGYPSLYYTFLTNVVESGVQNYVLPLPLDSGNAVFVLERKGIWADIVHIDGGHDYEAVLSDLRRGWRLLQPGGTLIADDYDLEGKVWPTVRAAVDDFVGSTPHLDFEAIPYKARFVKPDT